METIEELSALWHVPKSEVVRRSIAQSALAQADRKKTIHQLQDYWRVNSSTQDYSTQELEDYLLQVVEDRKGWRS